MKSIKASYILDKVCGSPPVPLHHSVCACVRACVRGLPWLHNTDIVSLPGRWVRGLECRSLAQTLDLCKINAVMHNLRTLNPRRRGRRRRTRQRYTVHKIFIRFAKWSHFVGKSAMAEQSHVCLVTHTNLTFSPLRTKQSTFRQGERSQKVSPFACPEPALRSRVLITSQCDKDGGNSWNSELFIEIRLVPVPLMEFMCLVFTHMPGKNYSRRLRSLLLCLRDVFWAPVNSLACSFLCYLSIAEIRNKPGETTQGRNTCL